MNVFNRANIYLIKDQRQFGPYSETELLNRVCAGECSGNDLAWFEGCNGAVPLSQIIAQPAIGRNLPARSSADLIFIANRQKAVIWTTVLWVVVGLLPRPYLLLNIIAGAW